MRIVLNSARYWRDGDPSSVPASTTPSISTTIPRRPETRARAVRSSVKGTDDDVPWLFGFIPLEVDPKRHARVEVQPGPGSRSGMLPWAVPEIEPAAVAALFVDENTGAVIGTQELEKRDDVTLPFLEWVTPGLNWSTTPPTEVTPNASGIDLRSENTGVVILTSKVDPLPDLTGTTLTEICTGDPLISCYAGDGNQDGLTFIHGWSDANGTPQAPVVRDVSVLNATCRGPLGSVLPTDRGLRARRSGSHPLRRQSRIRPADRSRCPRRAWVSEGTDAR